MIKLQSDFTTPEQSKRLLKLGVPANSANMWWEKDETILIDGEWVHGYGWSKVPSPFNWDRDNNRFYTYSETKEAVEDFTGNDTLPCWSVGRLMEIFNICNLYELHKFSLRDWSMNIEKIMLDYKVAAKEKMLDFSKLEE